MPKKTFSKNIAGFTYEVWNDRPTDLDLICVDQVHSNGIYHYSDESSKNNADAIISNNKNDILAIRTADCLPIVLIGDHEFALVHAGWRGLQSEILLQDRLKELKPQYAFIGPHIRVEQYEVGEDFKQNFPKSTHFLDRQGKIHFNMLAMAQEQLSSNYHGIIIEDSALDTFTNEDFHSYRRGDLLQRNWNILKYN
ncbi:polyphenol oxidase family protein [Halobacteriovorax sp. HLS]|uniref:polyphenol oxidase family protein n=1 Tax=Halobacteriovorax sp. HLS TaxID=2234000 RepID=UPI000FDC2FA4|nr:polyphenol oxidase family protein [Halobacteriovorax sp. HLS]